MANVWIEKGDAAAAESRETAKGIAAVGSVGSEDGVKSGAAGLARTAALPAVLVAPSEEIQFTDQQIVEWTGMQNDFIEAVGGANQDPADPAYRERWISAREESDDLFRAKFGMEAYVLQSIQASRLSNRR
jgi:hypothetical protein